MGVPPYTLFWDRTLDELCARSPHRVEELLGIWGIGEQKRRLFGRELMSLIQEYGVKRSNDESQLIII